MAIHRVAVEMSLQGCDTFNTFHVRDLAGGGPFTSVAERVGTQWSTRVMPRLSKAIRMVAVRSYNLTSLQEDEFLISTQGNFGDESLPLNVAFQATKVAPGGRNGRLYIAGLNEGVVDSMGKQLEAVRADNQTALQAFLTGIGGNNNLEMVLHKVDPAGVATTRVVSSMKVPPWCVTQKRRLDRARG